MVDIFGLILDSSFVTIGSKLVSIALCLVTLFLLFEIKSRVIEEARKTFVYLIIATVWMIMIRTLGIMDQLGIWVSSFYDSSVVIFSLFLVMGIVSFYNYIVKASRQLERSIYEPGKFVEEPKTILYTNKLNEMENKINAIEKRIRNGRIKTAEADRISRKFKLQLESLTEAYDKGYISKKAYETGRERIRKVNQSLKKKHL